MQEACAHEVEGLGHVVVGVVRQEGHASWDQEDLLEGEVRDQDAACDNQSLPV